MKKKYKPIVIFGEARSGSTWLAQIISASGYELNFEGFGSMNFSKDYKIPFKKVPEHFYIRKGEKNPYKNYIDLVMDCKLEDKFVYRGNINIGSPKKLIKLIRASLMIDWLQDNYDFYGIFIIRNPFATINSQFQKRFFLNLQEKGLTSKYPEKVINYFNREQQDLIYKAQTAKDRLAVQWCINNRIAIDVVDKNSIYFIKYEDLIDKSKRTIKKLSKFAKFPYTKDVKEMIYKESFTTRKNTIDPRTDWKKNFTQEEITSILEIVETFNLTEYVEL
jgi:hypothetical protein